MSANNNNAVPPTSIPQASAPPAESVHKAELDIVFCSDCTASMGAYIADAQKNIKKISQSIHDRAPNADVRYALVKYRDHCDQKSSFVTEVFPFTRKINVLQSNVDTMAAVGGGDGPEAVAPALYEVNELDWRPTAAKICVLISDAPPHGIEESGDDYPDGCPLGHDPIQITKSLAAKGVIVYAVGVEPTLSQSYKYARDFMIMVAKITEGKFLPLGKADILSDVIVNGALEGLSITSLWDKMEKEVSAEAASSGEKLTEEDLIQKVQSRMAEKKEVVAQVDVVNPYLDDRYDYNNVETMMKQCDLKSAKQHLKSNLNSYVENESRDYNWSKQEAVACSAAMSEEQCYRGANRARKTKGLFSFASS
jgi:hypothetical protein